MAVSRLVRAIQLLAVALLCAGCGKRSAHAAAERVSGLSLPRERAVTKYEEFGTGMFDQDYVLNVTLEFSPADGDRVAENARRSGFQFVRRPIAGDSTTTLGSRGLNPRGARPEWVLDRLAPGDSGWFVFELDDRRTRFVLFDVSRSRLIVEVLED